MDKYIEVSRQNHSDLSVLKDIRDALDRGESL